MPSAWTSCISATPHDQVGADDEREQDDTDRTQPGQQGEQESWQPADGVGEVRPTAPLGADRGHAEQTPPMSRTRARM